MIFFSKIGKKITDNIDPIEKSPMDYITLNNEAPNLTFDVISPTHVLDVIKQITPKKSCDKDGISNFLIKFVSLEISTPLAHIFNLSLTLGIYPSEFKTSRVVPIFKNGDNLSCDNYRPISLVSSIAKVLDKIVAVKLTNHLELNKLLYPYQFGFQKKSSTEHNLVHLTNFVSKALNDGKYCIGIFLDFKKAFDVVSHEILLKKLEKLNITDITLGWFKSYLSSRKQIVDIDGTFSDIAYINISVLQGSTLGPILFLCFINDLHKATNLFTLLFADDTCALACHNNLKELVTFCNTELQKISYWITANKLAVNVKKCKYILFHNKGKKFQTEDLKVVFNQNEIGKDENPDKITIMDRIFTNNPIIEDRSYKYLGISLDENFTLNSHFDNICKKLSRGLFCLRRARNNLNSKAQDPFTLPYFIHTFYTVH